MRTKNERVSLSTKYLNQATFIEKPNFYNQLHSILLCTRDFISQMNKSQHGARMSKKANKEKQKQFFSPEEDEELRRLVARIGDHDHWKQIAYEFFNGKYNSRQCRERYRNYLDPKWSHECYTAEEDSLLTEQVALHGNRWALIRNAFNGRSEVSLKNRWAHLRRVHNKIMSPSPLIEKISSLAQNPLIHTEDVIVRHVTPIKMQSRREVKPQNKDIFDFFFDIDFDETFDLPFGYFDIGL